MCRLAHPYKSVSDTSVRGAAVLSGFGISDSRLTDKIWLLPRLMYAPYPCVIAYDNSAMKKSAEQRKPDILHKTSSLTYFCFS